VRRSTPEAFQPTAAGAGFIPWAEGWTAAGVIEALEPLTLPRRAARMRAVLADRLESVTVVMDAPHDPHNGAAIIRSCEAFGLQRLHVVERVEAFLASRKVTQGTDRWVDVIRHASAAQALKALEREQFALAVAHPQGELLPEDLARLGRVALVMGNEHDGVCAELTRAATHSVRVPMRGFVESLNVSVTTALLLAAATRDRPGDLLASEQAVLYARALACTVPRAQEVLANLQPR